MQNPLFILFDLFSRFLAILPKKLLYTFSDMLFLVGYKLLGYRKKVVFKNLSNAFPEKSSREIKQTANQFYRHLCDVLTEDMAMLNMKPSRLKQFVTIKNLDVIDRLYQKDKNITAMIGHYGNWELLTTASLHTPYTILSVYKPLKNGFFDRKIYEMRKRFDEIPVPMKQAYKYIAGYEQSGRKYIAGLVADQSPMRRNINFRTTFLNQDTPFFTGAERMAIRFNHAVIFTAVKKRKRGYYEIEFIHMLDEAAHTQEGEITEMYARQLEKLIREQPQYWLWSHRRWKHSRSN